ncbi:MAG: hypothetical protein OEW04_05445 [Nitrospirota bacterium]|nr:hypothetical protein [Nitrospirota bacterium]
MTDHKEKRKYPRIGCDMPMTFSLSVLDFANFKSVMSKGNIVDKSDEGYGFFTDTRLEPGTMIRIRKEDDSYIFAMVKWVGEIEGKYRVGVLIYK